MAIIMTKIHMTKIHIMAIIWQKYTFYGNNREVLEAKQIQCDKFHLGLMNGWWSLVRWMYRCFPGEVWFFSEDNCQARKRDQIWSYVLFPSHAHRLWKLLFCYECLFDVLPFDLLLACPFLQHTWHCSPRTQFCKPPQLFHRFILCLWGGRAHYGVF